jgi:hypothetical protein
LPSGGGQYNERSEVLFVNPATLGRIARNPFLGEFAIQEVPSKYIGPEIPLEGTVSLNVGARHIHADLVNRDGWQTRMRQRLPQGTFVDSPLHLIRPIFPGALIRPEHRGSIVPDAGGWEAHRVTHYGISGGSGGDVFSFAVDALTIDGPAVGSPVAVMREIYSRGAWNTVTVFQGKPLLVTSLAFDEENACQDHCRELLAVTLEWKPDEQHAEALWNMLNFVTGNTVRSLAVEHYADDGRLIMTKHCLGSDVRDVRQRFFHIFHGQLSAEGVGVIADGLYRLVRARFPIEVVIQHLLAAAGNTIDVEAQHLVLALHTAIEAWNRLFDRETWIEQKVWKRHADRIRKDLIPEDLYQELGVEMKANIRDALAFANRKTMGWRQRNFFAALCLDVTDDDSVRILALRNELLHNGYFLKRFDELSYDEQQQRHGDIERLRRLAIMVTFRLVGYSGDFMNPVTFQTEHIDGCRLPDLIAPP